jgi:menaquinol-cytochrome c reductase iron-sulfur subunit
MQNEHSNQSDEPQAERPDKPQAERPDKPQAEQSADSSEPRRGFLTQVLALAVGAIVGLVPLLTGLLFFLDPLVRRRKGSDVDRYIRITTLDSLPSDGQPQMFRVLTDKMDAWNKFVDEPIGAIFLRRIDGDEVTAFNARCPHLGCAVDYRGAQQRFVCPCHDSSFDLSGVRSNAIPPRDLDSLEVEIRDGNEVWVKFEKFRAGTEEKITTFFSHT